MKYPDWKIKHAEECIRKKCAPIDSDCQIILDLLKKSNEYDTASRQLFDKCYEIYKKDFFIKEVIEGIMLCADYDKNRAAYLTDIPVEVLSTYERFFFDITVFEYKLHRYEYIRTYDNPKFPDGKVYKSWAVSLGMDFFSWKFNNHSFEILPRKAMISILGDMFFRAKEQLDEPINSTKAKEAFKYISKIPEFVKSLDNEKEEKSANFINDLKINLLYNDSTVTKDEIEAKGIEIIT